MHVSYFVKLHSFVDKSAYNEPRNSSKDIFKFYKERAVGKCKKLFLWVPSKLRNSQNLSVKFFLKHPVYIYTKNNSQCFPPRPRVSQQTFQHQKFEIILLDHAKPGLYH